MRQTTDLVLLVMVIFIGAFVYLYHDQLRDGLHTLIYGVPCSRPIIYSVGTFDERFGLSKDDFLSTIKRAESIWEKPIGLNLFEGKTNGNLKINLIYDYRQSATEKLQTLGIVVGSTRASYDELKAKYSSLQTSYLKDKTDFESQLATFKSRQSAYNKEVSYWNTRRGAPKVQYDAIQAEKKYLQSEADEINRLQDNLNAEVDNINALVSNLNRLAKELNLNVATFNQVGATRGEEFEEGLYKSGPDGQSINVYQYENENKLLRVLAHEFGHALGVEHLDDPKAIMYKLNQGTNEKLTASDVLALKTLCHVK
ncbi:MAG: matrixin family metalloprotease [bacterium]|nr:matrixin family metalloprotease [bacterium]